MSTESNVPSPASGNRGGRTRKPNKQKIQAEKDFNPNALPMDFGQHFDEFLKRSRTDVKTTFDQERFAPMLAVPYVDAVDAAQSFKDPDLAGDLHYPVLAETNIHIATARKLIMTVPAVDRDEVTDVQFLSVYPLNVPKTASVCIDALGKFDLGDHTIRVKYLVQDIYRILLQICIIAEEDDKFKGRYQPPLRDPTNRTWSGVGVDTVVVASADSATWIRDQAHAYLTSAYSRVWDMTDAAGNTYSVTYPRLEVSTDLNQQRRNVTDWIALLHQAMPSVRTVVAAGICTVWRKEFFRTGTIAPSWAALWPELPAWVPDPATILEIVGLFQFMPRGEHDLVNFIKNILAHWDENYPVFSSILDLIPQPTNEFGNEAQLAYYDKSAFKQVKSDRFEDYNYDEIREDARVTSFFNLGKSVRSGLSMILPYSKGVEFIPQFKSSLKSDPRMVRRQYLKSDMLRKWF